MNSVPRPVGVGVIGVGDRFRTLYGPLLRMLPGVRLAGICGRHLGRTAETASAWDTTAFPDTEALLGDGGVEAVIVCVTWSQNADLYRQILIADLPMLLETPLSADPTEASDIASSLLLRVSLLRLRRRL